MAKNSAIEKNNRRTRLAEQFAAKRDGAEGDRRWTRSLPIEERFARAAEARRAAAQLVAKTRIRNRCEMTGRPRAYYRKLKMSRIALRELGNRGRRSPAWSSRAGKEDTIC